MNPAHRAARLAILALALGTAIHPAGAAGAAHDHAAHSGRLQLDHGRKWATDEPLRANMRAMRSVLAERIPAIRHGKLVPEDYRTLGAAVEQHVGRIVAECRLAPEADAMLHIVVADLVAGADAMQGKSATAPAAGAHKVVEALNAYGRHFRHPGWRSLN